MLQNCLRNIKKFQVIDLQERMEKIILKLATPKRFTSLNMQRLREDRKL